MGYFSFLLQKEAIMQKLFLGCDVSKGYMDALILDSSGEVISLSRRYYDSPEGHRLLANEIKSKLIGSTTIYAGVESTGGYENNWISFFAQIANDYPLLYSRINPRAIANSAKVLMKRTVTDGVSATIIADYLRRYTDEIDFKQSDHFGSLRRVWSARELIQKGSSAIWQHLQLILYDANPVVLRYTRAELPQWVLLLLLKYPTAKKLSKARVTSLAKIPYISKVRAAELINAAKESIASDSDSNTEFLIQESVESLIDSQKRLKRIDKQLIIEMSIYPEIKLLTSIPGIGEITAVGLMMNIGDVNRFPNVKKLVSYFGIHPMFKESGDGKSISRMSKVGKKRPRTMLYMAVMGGLRTNIILNTMHTEAKSNGMAPQASIGKCMHKLLRIIYGVLKSETPFDIEIHNSHKLKGEVSKSDVTGKQSENIKIDEYAPISAREAKRQRDREAESHNEQSHYVRDHQPST